ncbi:MAG: hypothetical protein LBG28_09700 [Tannerella sp.]|nr:hypothetical protein [Tannerella sp.]
MKKQIGFFVALLVSAGMLAPQGLSAQQRVVKVQGHPHELLTKKAAEGTAKTAVSAAPTDTTYIVSDSIKCWIDAPKLRTDTQIDSAYLMIKFTDGKSIDNLFVWGYRWNPYIVYYDQFGNRDSSFVQYHGIDMLRTVANNDGRLTVLLQYTGKSGHAVGGIGLNWNQDGLDCSRLMLNFDLDGAEADSNVRFIYSGSTPDCVDGQVTTPHIPVNTRTGQAASESENTGILKHPFGAEYGYPAYDYDFWNLVNEDPNVHWQAGWYKYGVWGYYRAGNLRVPVPSADPNNDPDAALFSVTYEPLLNRQVHGFVFKRDFIVQYFDGTPWYIDCRCAPCTEESKGGNKR